MTALYNEIEPAALEAIRCLMEDGVIAPGKVDGRSIKELTADDIRGYAQCHFFAGAGTWSLAARLAGWSDDRPIWTASCPCQPFSAAGKGLGADDPRHLWPDLYRLIRTARDAGFGPSVLVGEQVAGKAGYAWFDGVRADLAREGIAARVVDFPALAVDAPHERNRLYWVAVDDTARIGRGEGRPEHELRSGRTAFASADVSGVTLGDSAGDGRGEGIARTEATRYGRQPSAAHRRNGGFWSDAEWILCYDGKARRTKPGLRLLVDGMAGRIPAWRLAGNGIVLPAAVEVIAALREVIDMRPA